MISLNVYRTKSENHPILEPYPPPVVKQLQRPFFKKGYSK